MRSCPSGYIDQRNTPTSTRWRSSALPTRPLSMKMRQPQQHSTRRRSAIGDSAPAPSWSSGPSGRAAPVGCRRRASGRSPLRYLPLVPAFRLGLRPWLRGARRAWPYWRARCTFALRSARVALVRLISSSSSVSAGNDQTRLSTASRFWPGRRGLRVLRATKTRRLCEQYSPSTPEASFRGEF